MLNLRRHRLAVFALIATALIAYQIFHAGSWSASRIIPHGQDTVHVNPQAPFIPDVPTPDDLRRPWTLDSAQSTKLDQSSGSSASRSKSTSRSTSTNTNWKSKPTITGNNLLPKPNNLPEDLVEEGSGRWEDVPALLDSRRARWEMPKVHFPIPNEEFTELPKGPMRKLNKIQASFERESSSKRKDRIFKRTTVKETFLHAWNGYKNYAMGKDEVKPGSRESADPFMGWGATLVDSLDTLWIMGLTQEFEEAVKHVAGIDFTTSRRKDIPLFEVTIRYLGGLLGAYDVSGHKYGILLRQAQNLAEILIGAFDTPNHMPLTFYNWAPSYTSQPHRAGAHVVMAELGTLSLEFTRLAQLTGNNTYYDAIARVTDELEKLQMNTLVPGLWPIKLDASGCKKSEHGSIANIVPQVRHPSVVLDSSTSPNTDMPTDVEVELDDVAQVESGPVEGMYKVARRIPPQPRPPLRQMPQEFFGVDCTPQGLAAEPPSKPQVFGIGGQADSTYEYLPKMHMLLGGRVEQYGSMYENAAQAIREKLLFRPMTKDKTDILFAAKHELSRTNKDPMKREMTTYEVTHLSCFVGGMFALGSKLFDVPADLRLGEKLTEGCVWAYHSMPTGIMAESAAVVPCMNTKTCLWNETQWHEALDPRPKERSAAVAAYNQKQQAIYHKAQKATSEADEGLRKAVSPPGFRIGDAASRKRGGVDEDGIGPTPTTEMDDDDGSSTVNVAEFVPKVALSHDQYVQARIHEEHLPPSYTKIFDAKYGLRPEALESVFYLYRITGDESWRDKGWGMFQAITQATHTEIAHSAIKDVTSLVGVQTDTMESFWLAETLKYAFLLFEEPDQISLDEWVFNTEAHPFRIPRK